MLYKEYVRYRYDYEEGKRNSMLEELREQLAWAIHHNQISEDEAQRLLLDHEAGFEWLHRGDM